LTTHVGNFNGFFHNDVKCGIQDVTLSLIGSSVMKLVDVFMKNVYSWSIEIMLYLSYQKVISEKNAQQKKYKQLTSDIWGKDIKNCFSSWGTWLVLISPNKLFPQTRSPKSHKTCATTMSMTGHHYNIPSTMKIQHLCLNNENTATV
jgi:hypothetical protein